MSNATNGFRTDSYWGPRLKVLCSRHGMKILELNNGQFYEVDLINNFGHVLNPIPRFPVIFRCAIFAKSTRPKNPSLKPKIFSVEDSHQFTVSHFHNFTTVSQLLRFFWGISQCWARELKTNWLLKQNLVILIRSRAARAAMTTSFSQSENYWRCAFLQRK